MSRHREAFEEFAERLNQSLTGPVDRIMLFGSVARGEEVEESDVDVLVVLEDKELKEEVFEISFKTTLDFDVYISPKVVSIEEFEELKEGKFYETISTEAQVYGKA
jgi:predicted nucleotidyltransferase